MSKDKRKSVPRAVPKGLEPFIAEFAELVKKHGVGSYALVAKNPDLADDAFAVYDGNTSWVLGRLQLFNQEIMSFYFEQNPPLEEDGPAGASRG